MSGKRKAPTYCTECIHAVTARVVSRRSVGLDHDSVVKGLLQKCPWRIFSRSFGGPCRLPDPCSKLLSVAYGIGALATVEVLGSRIRASGPIRPNETVRSRPIRDSGSIPIRAQELDMRIILNRPGAILSVRWLEACPVHALP